MLGLEQLIVFMAILASALIGASANPLCKFPLGVNILSLHQSNTLDYDEKRANFNRDFMHFGKRAADDLYGLEDGQVGFIDKTCPNHPLLSVQSRIYAFWKT